jgi:hypothetical protein
MKCRDGFVTNSSSSSFLVAHKDVSKVVDEDTQRKYPFIGTMIHEVKNILVNMSTAKTEDELKELFLYHMMDGDYRTLEEGFADYGEYWKDQYENALKKIKEGYTVSYERFDNWEDEGKMKLLNSIADDKTLYIICGEE